MSGEEQSRESQTVPVYPHSRRYAYEHGEEEQHMRSLKENIACKNAIEQALNSHYDGYSLDTGAAVKEVADVFGYDRMLHVLALSIQDMSWDGRISRDNISWARTQPIEKDVWDPGGWDQNDLLRVNTHPGLTDMFTKKARHDYLLTQPLTVPEIQQEAARLLRRLNDLQEPNSPNKTHFMAEVSRLFVERASSKELTALKRFLPYKSLALAKVKGRNGVFAAISGDESRGKELRKPRQSVLDKLQEPALKTAPKRSARLKEMEL